MIVCIAYSIRCTCSLMYSCSFSPFADDGGDDSDGDLVTDYLNANNNSNGPTTAAIHPQQPSGLMDNNSTVVGAAAGGARQPQQQHQQQQHLLQQQQSQDLSTGTSATTATTSNTTTPRSSRGSIHLYSNNCSGGGGSGGKGNGGNGGGQNGAYNMVPIISVTPHSPGTKFSGILGKTKNVWSKWEGGWVREEMHICCFAGAIGRGIGLHWSAYNTNR